MNIKTTPIINSKELIDIQNSENLVIVDASAGSRERYNQTHLKEAHFVDVNNDLANIGDFAVGGRHPLPTPEQFSSLLQRLGIDQSTRAVVYDDKNGANAAARLWWMLRAIGHEDVQVIDGGFDAAVKWGFPTSSEVPTPNKVELYPVGPWTLALSTIDEVEKVVQDPDHIVIDVRDADRYAGLTEHIDLVAGHIPGAINIPFTENLNPDGTFKASKDLKEKYAKILANVSAQNVIVHCGSGITACHTLLAMDHAGLPIPSLYVGSWSEWSRNKL